MQATALAHPNIALVKYWGKRDTRLNLPAVGSLSITLSELRTRTHIEFMESAGPDSFLLNGGEDATALKRASTFLDTMYGARGSRPAARIETDNNFPTAAGLASSASGFAALAVAVNAALGLGLGAEKLSECARRGSGSAGRSIFGGFVEMARGELQDGSDSIARPLLDPDAWSLRVVVAVTSLKAKAVGSTSGMGRAAASPYFDAWVATSPSDITVARGAVQRRDFAALADVSEHSCLKMHAVMMAGRPPLIYWNSATVECMNRVRLLRNAGTAAFFTMDAGPQVKVICEPADEAAVVDALGSVPGVAQILRVGLGGGARIVG